MNENPRVKRIAITCVGFMCEELSKSQVQLSDVHADQILTGIYQGLHHQKSELAVQKIAIEAFFNASYSLGAVLD